MWPLTSSPSGSNTNHSSSSDLGSPFTAIEFKSWAQDCSISIDYASVAHSQANGQVERADGLILVGLKPRLYEDLKDYVSKWIDELPKVV
jgi:transposase InsO family protein